MVYRVIWSDGKVQKRMDFESLLNAVKWSHKHNGKVYKVIER